MSEHDLLAAVCETSFRYLALGNEAFGAHGATFIRSRATPHRRDVNAVGLVRTDNPAEIYALLHRVEVEYAGLGHRRYQLDPLTPLELEARLTIEGYAPNRMLCLLLEGELRGTPRPVEIREVVTDADWQAYEALDRLWWSQTTTDEVITEGLIQESTLEKRLKSQRGVRFWLACVEDVPRAFFASWPGDNGVGMVEDLFCHPDYRHRGLATALIAHCVADARARGAGPVLIGADPTDTPKQMYAALGFRPLYVGRNYVKLLS